MLLLLDTCDFLWFINDDPKLPSRRKQAIQDQGNLVFLSSISVAEISIKYALGKLILPEHPETYIRDARIRHDILSLPFTEDASLLMSDLPLHHKDPFDRMLVCHALLHGMTFVTSDPKNHFYNLPLI